MSAVSPDISPYLLHYLGTHEYSVKMNLHLNQDNEFKNDFNIL